MAFLVSPVDLKKDREALIDFLARNLSSAADDKRYDWLYTKCPFGPALAWFARRSDSSEIVGAAAAFPRQLHIGDSSVLGWVLGDFCIRPDYRTLGPALKLQRACLENGNGEKRRPLYDFPSSSMVAIYKRLGMEPAEQFVRMAKPLRTDRRIRERIKNPLLARGLSAAANSLLAIKDLPMKSNEDWSIALHLGRCTEEFSRLSQPANLSGGLWTDRSADYLNWRYLDHPHTKYEILAARKNEQLRGYLIFTCTGEDASIVDWFGIADEKLLQALVQNAVILLRQRGAATLSASLLESHRRVRTLEDLGFYKRESRPVVLQAPLDSVAGNEISKLRWFLMDGDRES